MPYGRTGDKVKDMKWRVQKCKPPSTRWVAIRIQQKLKSGVVFTTWAEAVTYARLMYVVDSTLSSVKKDNLNDLQHN